MLYRLPLMAVIVILLWFLDRKYGFMKVYCRKHQMIKAGLSVLVVVLLSGLIGLMVQDPFIFRLMIDLIMAGFFYNLIYIVYLRED